MRDEKTRELHICGVQETMGAVDFLCEKVEQDAMGRAIKAARAVVVDTGTNVSALVKILKIGDTAKLIHCVNVEKCAIFPSIFAAVPAEKRPFLAVMGTPREIGRALDHQKVPSEVIGEMLEGVREKGLPPILSARHWSKLGAQFVLMTPSVHPYNDRHWHVIRCSDGAVTSGDIKDIVVPAGGAGNYLGISESVSSAFIHHLSRGGSLQEAAEALLSDTKEKAILDASVRAFVSSTVSAGGATPNSLLDEKIIKKRSWIQNWIFGGYARYLYAGGLGAAIVKWGPNLIDLIRKAF